MIIEGTWEEIAPLMDKLAGRRLRVRVLPDHWDEDENDEEDYVEQPYTWEQLDREVARIQSRLAEIWPKGVSAEEAVAEQRR